MNKIVKNNIESLNHVTENDRHGAAFSPQFIDIISNNANVNVYGSWSHCYVLICFYRINEAVVLICQKHERM